MRKLIVLSAIALLMVTTSTAQASASWKTTKIVAGLLCIHDGHHYTYKGHGLLYRLKNYRQGAAIYYSNGARFWGEGSWTDPNGPYWGGLQMDLSFQKAYGSTYYRQWGTADHWPPWAQLRAGTVGARARGGFNPWSTSADTCGLPRNW